MGKEHVKSQVKGNNPKGKGGFQDHPELRNNTGIEKDLWWRNLFIEMATEKKDGRERRRNVAEAVWDKAETGDISAFKEIRDTMDGKPQQSVDHTTGGDKVTGFIVEFASASKDRDTRGV